MIWRKILMIWRKSVFFVQPTLDYSANVSADRSDTSAKSLMAQQDSLTAKKKS